MKLFFRFVVCYAVVSFSVTALSRDAGLELLTDAAIATIAFSKLMISAAIWAIPLIIAVPLVMGWRRFVENLHVVGYAMFGTILFQAGFSFLKSTIPLIVPFYADPAFAAFDKWLHGGVDPWVLAHDLGQYLPMDALLPVYLSVWSFPAIAFAVVVAMSDRDSERSARFMVLYAVCWVLLGNVLAMAGSSAGPIFYDQLLGGDRFAALHAVLDQSGLADSQIGRAQFLLWKAYSENGVALGSGISAFPSVHVGIATLTALYMAERSRWLILPGLFFFVIILFLSVYTGYHYAIDGYASTIVIVGLWAVLRRIRLTEIDLQALFRRRAGAVGADAG